MNDIANTTLFIFFLGLAIFFGAILLTIELEHRRRVRARKVQNKGGSQ